MGPPPVAFRPPDGMRDAVGEPQAPAVDEMRPSVPQVGDRLRTDGQEWVVVRVARGNSGSSITVTLRPLDGAVTAEA